MASLRLLTVVGARPQFIKAAPLSHVLADAGFIEEVMVHTGQHYDADMSDIFFEELGIPCPRYQLAIGGGSHGEMTGRMLKALEAVMVEARPQAVVVYGDTNSTLAGALAAAKLGLPIAHIEAGLRSFNRRAPEEINRIVADRVSDLLFCPTRAAVENLAQEGMTAGITQVGDIMYDATLRAAVLARERSTILERLQLAPKHYAVATVHRAENTDDPATLAGITAYLVAEARQRPVVFPIHPRTRRAIAKAGLALDGVRTTAPLGYLDMHRLLEDAAVVLTDSGGLQKEAYFHRVPCVTLRGETECVETVACGWNRLWTVGDYRPRVPIADYGDGRAAEKIVAKLVERFGAGA